MTPLQWACGNGHAEVTKALLEQGADVNAKTRDGCTRLLYACENGQPEVEVVKMLLEKGADVMPGTKIDRYPYTMLVGMVMQR